MKYARMAIEVESPEEYGYDLIRNNLSESSIRDRTIADFGLTIPNLTLLYGEHRGDKRLRELVAAQGSGLSADDVLVTTGAAGALFIISTTLLRPADHLVVIRPNYATNIETPRAIGCQISLIDLKFEDGFAINLDAVRQAIQANTRLVSVTCPHNPTGTMLTREQLDGLVSLTGDLGIHLLVDETYRDLSYDVQLPISSSLADHVISVSSLSKAYGIPGVRTGWLITKDPELYVKFLAAKEQINICGSIVDEWISGAVLEQRDDFLALLRVEMRKRLSIVRDWVASEPMIDWIEPSGGVVCFPKIVADAAFDTKAFYARLLEKHGTYVGPGHWFEMPTNFFRIGYLWPTQDELHAGLEGISKALRD
ncbi:aminotransferase class V-fold PLP-dependent enzyme [Sphingobium amiense]|uniref:Aminotransferase class V-fold PLP-dependent enzyme n=1 Tax=Sphingobium amiense TaxID=135719 RepID=A0A494WEC0_9SPHN|nr:pyridoxal phosphate-dependent aminotransferase [Sphingobium amiense]BBD98799.1 aminotransferase class V-fold PLP-dependent enzyme [Sphingobium amiense]